MLVRSKATIQVGAGDINFFFHLARHAKTRMPKFLRQTFFFTFSLNKDVIFYVLSPFQPCGLRGWLVGRLRLGNFERKSFQKMTLEAQVIKTETGEGRRKRHSFGRHGTVWNRGHVHIYIEATKWDMPMETCLGQISNHSVKHWPRCEVLPRANCPSGDMQRTEGAGAGLEWNAPGGR